MYLRFAGALSAALLVSSVAHAGDITGAGATFPAPVYAKWAAAYKAATNNGVNYQAIGSGGGIKQIKAKTVDFGGTDKPLTAADQNAAGLYQFPTVIGGVVPIVNIPGLASGRLRLSGQLLAEIYLGQVKNWNDGRIAAFNKGLVLPNLPITVVHRSDGSGTSFLYTTYLSMVNATWKAKVGASDAVSWPAGLGGKGNDGVSALVKQTTGSIGYVEYAFAKQNHETTAIMQNHDGQFVAPAAVNFAAAASGARWASSPGNYVLLLNQPGAKSWPITGVTYILVYKNEAKGADVLKFFDWAYNKGDQMAASLDYVPLPAGVKAMIRKQWGMTLKSGGKAAYAAH